MQTKHSDRSHVGVGVHVCPVCLKEHDEVVLLDTCLRPTLERWNFVGWAMCDEHEALWQKGYIALIECTNESQTTSLADAKRTGQIAHVRKEAWPSIFSGPILNGPAVFVQQGVIEQLRALMSKEQP